MYRHEKSGDPETQLPLTRSSQVQSVYNVPSIARCHICSPTIMDYKWSKQRGFATFAQQQDHKGEHKALKNIS